MKKHLIVIGIIFVLLIVGFSGCINENVNVDGDKEELSIDFFNVEPSIITQGGTANLSWNVTGASTVSINMGIGAVGLSGTRIISPTQNTTYMLTASTDSKSINASAYIIVEIEEVEIEDEKELSVNFLNVEPSIITQGGTANLSWNVTGASTVSINMGIGNVGLSGTRIISPSQNTTYMLTASNDTKSINASASIIVESLNNPPEDLTITGPGAGNLVYEHTFYVSARDEDEDDSIRYIINWGDGYIDTSEYMESESTFEISHIWGITGTYNIEVYAEDESNARSETISHYIEIYKLN